MEKIEAPPAFVAWWFKRAWTLNEVAVILDASYDTLYRWISMIRAAGIHFGEKSGREWLFDSHELYALRVLAAFMKAGIPVGPTHLRAVVFFVYTKDGRPRAPEGKLVQTGPASEFSIDAPAIFNSVIEATNPKHVENGGRYAQ